ncbi:MAG: 4'-phosphopantetheinyl transferase superfamily protein [Bradyrhizobium sp.]
MQRNPRTAELVFVPTDVPLPSLSKLAAVLTSEETEHAARFHFEADRRRSIVGRASLRHLLSHRLGGDARQFRFERGAHGKPFLPNSEYHFNLSHSGGVVAIALAKDDIGVDIEARREVSGIGRVAARFFSSDEAERVHTAMDPTDAFLRIWVMKEAVVKAAGGGIYLPLDRFAVPSSAKVPQPLQLFGDAPMLAGWSVVEAEVRDGYYGAVAMRGSAWQVAARWEDPLDLLR